MLTSPLLVPFSCGIRIRGFPFDYERLIHETLDNTLG